MSLPDISDDIFDYLEIEERESMNVDAETFKKVCKAAGLPEPESEVCFAKPRKWRFDFAWPAERIAVEVEGGVWNAGRHTRGSGFLKDCEKYNEAAIRGWCLLRTTPDELTSIIPLVQRAMKAKSAA